MRGNEPSEEGSTDDRDEKDGLVTPLRPVERKCHGRTDDGQQQPQNHKRQAHGTQRPSERSGAAVAHPTGSSPLILFSYPFCHNTTLQTPLYSTTASWASRQTLRRSFPSPEGADLQRIHLPRR